MDEIEAIAKIPSTGDDVSRRFRYQYLYTVLLSIKMYTKNQKLKDCFVS